MVNKIKCNEKYMDCGIEWGNVWKCGVMCQGGVGLAPTHYKSSDSHQISIFLAIQVSICKTIIDSFITMNTMYTMGGEDTIAPF